MALSRENITKITDLLKQNPQGLSITDIVKETGINRNTAGRYLERLLISGQVEMRHFGMAKIYTASQRVPVSAMLSISSDLVMQLDSGLRIIFANRPFLQLLGVTSEELLGKNIEFTAAATVFDDVLENFISHLKNGVQGKEWRSTLTLNNGERVFSCHISPITFNDGRKGVSVLLEDVTEIRRKEHELRESEERFRKLVEISPDAVFLHRDGKIIYANPAAQTLLGASNPGEVTGKVILDFVDPAFHGIIRENIQKDLDGELSPQMELSMLRLDGKPVIVEGRGVKTSIDGQPAVMVTLRDITDRKQAEEKLFNSRQMLQLVLDTIPVRVFWKDRDLVFLGANQALARDAGFTNPEDLFGKTDYDTAFAATADQYQADDLQVMETGTPKLDFEERQERRGGSQAWLRTSKVPLRNKSGDVIGILGTYEDITERKILEDELNATAERYKQLAECSLDALVITDLRGDVITTNKAALTLVGLEDHTEVQGTSVFRFVAPESREQAQRAFAAMGPSRRAVMQTYAGITALGNHITVEVLANPITYKDSPAIIISIREISKRTLPGKTSKRMSKCSG
ncbi:MAG: PAS domain S-box protein [Methanoregula sp.]